MVSHLLNAYCVLLLFDGQVVSLAAPPPILSNTEQRSCRSKGLICFTSLVSPSLVRVHGHLHGSGQAEDTCRLQFNRILWHRAPDVPYSDVCRKTESHR